MMSDIGSCYPTNSWRLSNFPHHQSWLHVIILENNDNPRDINYWRNWWNRECHSGTLNPSFRGGIIGYHPADTENYRGHLHLLYKHHQHSFITQAIKELSRRDGLRFRIFRSGIPQRTGRYILAKGPENILYMSEEFSRKQVHGGANNIGEAGKRSEDVPEEMQDSCDEEEPVHESSNGTVQRDRSPVSRQNDMDRDSSGSRPTHRKIQRFQQTSQSLVNKFEPQSPREMEKILMKFGTQEEMDFVRSYKNLRQYESVIQNYIDMNNMYNSFQPWIDIMDNAKFTADVYYDCTFLSVDDSIRTLRQMCKFNNWDMFTLINDVIDIVDKKRDKVNCLWFYGPASCGKTYLANSIVRSIRNVAYVEPIVSRADSGRFTFQSMINRRIALFNEGTITDCTIEKYKNIIEGQAVETDVKFKAPTVIDRTPVIWTSNTLLWQGIGYHQQGTHVKPILDRVIKYSFMSMPFLKTIKGQLNPLMWKELYNNKEEICNDWIENLLLE